MKNIIAALAVFTLSSAVCGQTICDSFVNPPDEFRPWCWYIWQNGNMTKEGITADLEAMQAVGIGGLIIMDVGYEDVPPHGPIKFMSKEWRAMFKHTVDEGKRLGLKVSMFNCVSFGISAGFWVKPENSMQQLVFSETTVEADAQSISLPKPQSRLGFYRDVAVLAFPTPARADKRKLPEYSLGYMGKYPDALNTKVPATNPTVSRNDIIDLSYSMTPEGLLRWTPPSGRWTVLRIGHTSTGATAIPPPFDGNGLECDKFSSEGVADVFNGQIKKLIDDNRENAGVGKTFELTHVDSWEVGSQNWTRNMPNEFRRWAKYDILPFLPIFCGFNIDSPDSTQRFLWDFRATASKLLIENFAKPLREMANRQGLDFSCEAYDQAPADFLEYGGASNRPTGEFWTNKRCLYSDTRRMASAAHIYGHQIVMAESFTAYPDDRWSTHPATFKPVGDAAFCEGINHFMIHAYTMQPRKVGCKKSISFLKKLSPFFKEHTLFTCQCRTDMFFLPLSFFLYTDFLHG